MNALTAYTLKPGASVRVCNGLHLFIYIYVYIIKDRNLQKYVEKMDGEDERNERLGTLFST